ncbi:MAG: amidohydrolase family protein [Bryobacterales bacterium]|nr:amidohydrolase family protein [Bryobacterales bacterium]
MRVADSHVHFFSHRFFSMLAAQTGGTLDSVAAALGWQMPPERAAEFANFWVEELDRHGVSRAAIIASLPGDELSVAEAVAAFPGRFFGYFFVNPVAPAAAATVEQSITKHGLQGACFFPAMHGYAIDDGRVLAVLDVLAATPGCLAFVHCGVLSVGFRKKLKLPSLFDMRFSNPIGLHAVALRYPKLPFVVPHFGAGYLREALMLADMCPNVYLDTSSTNAWMKYEPQGLTLEKVFERALAVAGPERLLFGTDSSFFPRGWHAQVFAQQVAALAAVGAGAADASAVLGGNLERLLERNA